MTPIKFIARSPNEGNRCGIANCASSLKIANDRDKKMGR